MQNYICASIIGVAIASAGWLVRDGISNSGENIAAYGDANLPGFFHAKGGKIRNCTTWPVRLGDPTPLHSDFVWKDEVRIYVKCGPWTTGSYQTIGFEGQEYQVPAGLSDDEQIELLSEVVKAAKASAIGK